MLNMAAGLLEQGRYESPYELVMADEFQDASRARARLCRALVSRPGRYLFAVGDDWQSINRFAGADVSVMTGFREWMGHGQVLNWSRHSAARRRSAMRPAASSAGIQRRLPRRFVLPHRQWGQCCKRSR